MEQQDNSNYSKRDGFIRKFTVRRLEIRELNLKFIVHRNVTIL